MHIRQICEWGTGVADHDQYEWEYSNDLGQYEFAPADIKFVEIFFLEIRNFSSLILEFELI